MTRYAKIPRPSTTRILCAVFGWTPRDVLLFTRHEIAVLLRALRKDYE